MTKQKLLLLVSKKIIQLILANILFLALPALAMTSANNPSSFSVTFKQFIFYQIRKGIDFTQPIDKESPIGILALIEKKLENKQCSTLLCELVQDLKESFLELFCTQLKTTNKSLNSINLE